jgi:magnesium chelatase subunit H
MPGRRSRALFLQGRAPAVDAVVSLTGFSLVGGPAYNDAKAAEDMLARLDVPYIAAHALEFQTLAEWEGSDRGLQPVEATMMVAIPELDGSTGPMIFGGRPAVSRGEKAGEHAGACRPRRAARRPGRALVALRRSERAERKVAVVLFNFPPNAGATGTAAYLAVFASLFRTLKRDARGGLHGRRPGIRGRAARSPAEGQPKFGADANVFHRIPVEDHVRREPHLAEIEGAWGPAPGRQLTDGQSLFVLGEQFGNVFVGIQPGFGYEGDPMRLLFEKGFAPTHAFSPSIAGCARTSPPHAVLHFGTHGALEFMPGKQAGLSAACWPERLIGDLPNLYLYAANNPSEGTIAKRRAAATLISHLTPPVTHAGLYKGLVELKSSLDRWRGLPPDAGEERAKLAELVQCRQPSWSWPGRARLDAMPRPRSTADRRRSRPRIHPHPARPARHRRAALADRPGRHAGRHGRGERGPGAAARRPRGSGRGHAPEATLALTETPRDAAMLEQLRLLAKSDRLLAEDHELPAILQALDGRFVRRCRVATCCGSRPSCRPAATCTASTPSACPRPSPWRMAPSRPQRLIERHMADGNKLPETVAMVLWGTDNLKSEGGPIAQVLA